MSTRRRRRRRAQRGLGRAGPGRLPWWLVILLLLLVVAVGVARVFR